MIFRVLSLFDGISCGQVALEKLGITYEYYASEIDEKSISITQKRFPNTIQIGDITKLTDKFLLSMGPFDLIMGGSPCQGFSPAGLKKGFADPRSQLFYAFDRILKLLKPKYFLLENANMNAAYKDTITKAMNCEPYKINAAKVSAQNRVRNYWTNIPIDFPLEDQKITLDSIIGPYAGIWVYPRGFNKGGIQGYKQKCPCITTSSWEHNFKIAGADKTLRKFTPEECEQVQGLPRDYTKELSNSQRFKKIGNGWSVPVIDYIFSFMIV